MGRTFLQGQTVQWVPNENPGARWQPHTVDPEAFANSPNHASDSDDDSFRTTKMPWKNRIAWFVVVLVIISGMGMFWMFGLKKILNDDDYDDYDHNRNYDSAVPSAAPSTSLPTTTSFLLKDLLFEPPSDSNCNAIARNETIAGRWQMEDSHFRLGLDVVLPDNSAMTDALVQDLLDAIQEKILPSLVGCSVIVDEFVEHWRFVIYDAFVTLGNSNQGEEEGCELVDLNCHRISIELTLFLKAPARILDITYLIGGEADNIENHLELDDLFRVVKLVMLQSLVKTPSPTIVPSSAPTVRLLYPPPSESDCDSIAKNETVAGREQVENVKFDLDFEVVLMDDNTMTTEFVNQFLDSMQYKMLPSLAGCNVFLDDFVEDWRYVIFDAFVTGNPAQEKACTDNIFISQNCYGVSLQLNLFLKGPVRLVDIIGLISDDQDTLSVDGLGLSVPFSAVRLSRLEPKV